MPAAPGVIAFAHETLSSEGCSTKSQSTFSVIPLSTVSRVCANPATAWNTGAPRACRPVRPRLFLVISRRMRTAERLPLAPR
jgi:hypothetical protein